MTKFRAQETLKSKTTSDPSLNKGSPPESTKVLLKPQKSIKIKISESAFANSNWLSGNNNRCDLHSRASGGVIYRAGLNQSSKSLPIGGGIF